MVNPFVTLNSFQGLTFFCEVGLKTLKRIQGDGTSLQLALCSCEGRSDDGVALTFQCSCIRRSAAAQHVTLKPARRPNRVR